MCVLKYHAFIFPVRPPRWRCKTIMVYVIKNTFHFSLCKIFCNPFLFLCYESVSRGEKLNNCMLKGFFSKICNASHCSQYISLTKLMEYYFRTALLETLDGACYIHGSSVSIILFVYFCQQYFHLSMYLPMRKYIFRKSLRWTM